VTFLNDQDARPTRAVTDDDRTHRLVLSGVWQLPFGKGRRFAGDVNRAAELVIGGWEYTWIASIQSGRPLNLPGNVDLIGDLSANRNGYDRFFNNCVRQLDGTKDDSYIASRPGGRVFRCPSHLRHRSRRPVAPQFFRCFDYSLLPTSRKHEPRGNPGIRPAESRNQRQQRGQDVRLHRVRRGIPQCSPDEVGSQDRATDHQRPAPRARRVKEPERGGEDEDH
jgi:hypothetical protein